jgi:broad specificity phosphatase PhoE
MRGTRIWFLRHGEVEERYLGTFLGTTDARLSPLGRHQAEAVKEYLRDAPLEAVLSSPRMRSRETIAPLAHELGLKVEVRPNLAEMDFGRWEAKPWSEIEAMDPGFARQWATDPATIPCPGGESCDTFFDRVCQEVARIEEEFRGRTIAIASHAGTNRCILGRTLAIPYLGAMRISQDYGCVNAVGWGEEGFSQVALVNFVPGPRSKQESYTR